MRRNAQAWAWALQELLLRRLVVIITGFSALRFTFRGARVLRPFVARERGDHQVNSPAHELGRKIRMAKRRDFSEELVDDFKADFGMRHFAAAEFERHLHLHVLAQEVHRVFHLDAKVMRVNAGAELHFLDGGGMLNLARIHIPLGPYVAKFADFHKAADRGHRVGRNFDQIHAVADAQGSGRRSIRKTPELFEVRPDDADFTGTNLAVYSLLRSGGGITLGRKSATHATLCWLVLLAIYIKTVVVLILTMPPF